MPDTGQLITLPAIDAICRNLLALTASDVQSRFSSRFETGNLRVSGR